MNASTRKKLNDHISTLEAIMAAVEELRDEEQSKYDNLSEGLQQAESGQQLEQAANALDSAYNSAQEAKDYIEEAAQ